MRRFFPSALLAACASVAAAQVHLAVSPNCGSFSGSVSDANAGIGPLSTYKTILAFGDAYTDGGAHNGGPLPPAVLTPPNPKAGGRTSNGPVWVEYLAQDAGATLVDFAAAGAVVDATQWPGANFDSQIDFVYQSSDDAPQYSETHQQNPNTTLYVIFFGIGDYEESVARHETTANSSLTRIADDVVYQTLVLASAPTFAKNILVVDNYGRGTESATGDAWKQEIFTSLAAIRSRYGVNVAFADLKTIWDGVLGTSPGYAAFGYTSPGACTVSDTTTVGACADPDHTFYWIPGYPSTATHRLVATYIEEVLTQCQTA